MKLHGDSLLEIDRCGLEIDIYFDIGGDGLFLDGDLSILCSIGVQLLLSQLLERVRRLQDCHADEAEVYDGKDTDDSILPESQSGVTNENEHEVHQEESNTKDAGEESLASADCKFVKDVSVAGKFDQGYQGKW